MRKVGELKRVVGGLKAYNVYQKRGDTFQRRLTFLLDDRSKQIDDDESEKRRKRKAIKEA